ncbi:Sec-independent protein translocase TatC [Dokdonia sp. Hel_I_63]|uniref:twin-arginine translocase subunit TatC n=1 Tax=unclassified Dokdonia TaxID=2615033 RepID=UPI00020A644F|nr:MULTISPECIES: twin-arginine translocase subunit TatC [unclassified Dokdonia]AEE18368.1 Sec-independent protein translocase, TatC subunit [Dokdonia sp. 4H-3-7-5]TVZ22399.1 Sec-independent protein translocase TatC [Dokdonia sp. Hel_I_63]
MAKKVKKHPDEMSFLDHLEELRWHLIRATLAVVIIGTVAFIFKGTLFEIIFGPQNPDFVSYDILCKISQFFGAEKGCIADGDMDFIIQSRKVAGQFSAAIWTSIMAGVVIGFPYILYEFWKFISPGLYENERKSSKGFIVVASLLFFLGAAFGYFVVAPLSINFLATFKISDAVQNEFDIDSFIGLVRASVLASGLIFELPIIMYFLTKIGLVTPEFLKKNRKYALVIVLILAAIITPPDISTQVIVAVPIIILYEVSIFISRGVIRREKRRLKKQGLA